VNHCVEDWIYTSVNSLAKQLQPQYWIILMTNSRKHSAVYTLLLQVSVLCPWRSGIPAIRELANYLISINVVDFFEYQRLCDREIPNYIEITRDFGVPHVSAFLRESTVPIDELPENIVWNFWRTQRNTLPVLAAVVQKLAMLQPSSAGVERVFSLFRHMNVTHSALDETLCLQTVLHHNSKVALHLNGLEVGDGSVSGKKKDEKDFDKSSEVLLIDD